MPLAALAMGAFTVGYVDDLGGTFFNNGKEVLGRLSQFAKKLQARDAAGLEPFYSPSFQGRRLGLTSLKHVDLKDGVHRLVLTDDHQAVTRDGAIAEWRAYLDSFDSIEEASLHIH